MCPRHEDKKQKRIQFKKAQEEARGHRQSKKKIDTWRISFLGLALAPNSPYGGKAGAGRRTRGKMVAGRKACCFALAIETINITHFISLFFEREASPIFFFCSMHTRIHQKRNRNRNGKEQKALKKNAMTKELHSCLLWSFSCCSYPGADDV